MGTTATKPSAIPAVTGIADPNIRSILSALKNNVEIYRGVLPNADPLDMAVTYRILAQGGFDVSSIGGKPGVNSPGGGGGGGGLPEAITPPAPTGLVATGTFAAIQLSWDTIPYANNAYTEIWRASVDDLGQAVRVGGSPGFARLYTDYVASSTAYYYWIRFVSTSSTPGPYNATHGTLGQTSPDPGYVLEVLSGQISETELDNDLRTQIALIPSLQGAVEDLVSDFDDITGTVTGIQTDVGALQTTAETLQDNVTTLFASLADTIADVDNNSSAINAINITLAEHGSDIDTAAAAITALQSNYTSLAGDVSSTATALSALTTRVTTAEGNITSNAAAITGVETDLGSLSDTVDANSSAITALESTTASQGASITSLSTSVTTLTSSVSDLSTGVETNADAISALTTRVTTAEGNISSNASAITSLSSDLSDLSGSLDTTNTNVAANASAISALTTTVTSQGSTISSQSSSITALESSISSLQAQINDISSIAEYDSGDSYLTGDLVIDDGSIWQAKIDNPAPSVAPPNGTYWELIGDYSSLAEQVAANTSAISGLDARVTTTEGSISTLSSSVTSLTASVSGLTTTVGGHTTSIAANTTAISSLDTRVTAAEGTITSQTKSITQLQAQVGGVGGVGPNLLSNPGFETNSFATYTADAGGTIQTSGSAHGGTYYARIPCGAGAPSLLSEYLPVEPGQSIFISAYVRKNAGTAPTGAARLAIRWANSAQGAISTSSVVTVPTSASGTFTLFQGTATAPALSGFMRFDFGGATGSGFWDIDDLVMKPAASLVAGVLGNASAITALDARVTTAEGNISSQATSITSLNSSVSSINTTLTAQGSAISSLQTLTTTQGNTISSQGTAITGLQSSLATVSGTTTANALAISTLQTTVSNQGTTISGQATSIGTLQTQVGGLSTSLQVEQSVRAISDAPNYNAALTYQANQLVVSGSQVYRAKQNVPTNTAPPNTTYWETYSTAYAQYTVKADVNGRVTGFGFDNSGPAGAPSNFIIISDRFAVSSPNNSSTRYPFIIDTTTGQVVMDTALIRIASITSAQINNLAVDKLTVAGGPYCTIPGFGTQASCEAAGGTWKTPAPAATLASALIGEGEVTNLMIGEVIQSDNFANGVAGWQILKSGQAQFNDNVTVYGGRNVFGANSLFNGGFETGDLAGWSGSPNTAFATVQNDGQAFIGTRYARLQMSGVQGYLYQVFNVLPGERIYAACMVRQGATTPSGGGFFLDISWRNSTDSELLVSSLAVANPGFGGTGKTWGKLTGNAVAPTNAVRAYVRLRINAGTGQWDVDAAEARIETTESTIGTGGGVTISGGGITMQGGGALKIGQSDFDNGIGGFFGYSGGVPKFSVGNSAGNKLTYDSSTSLMSLVGRLVTSSLTTAERIDINAPGAEGTMIFYGRPSPTGAIQAMSYIGPAAASGNINGYFATFGNTAPSTTYGGVVGMTGTSRGISGQAFGVNGIGGEFGGIVGAVPLRIVPNVPVAPPTDAQPIGSIRLDTNGVVYVYTNTGWVQQVTPKYFASLAPSETSVSLNAGSSFTIPAGDFVFYVSSNTSGTGTNRGIVVEVLINGGYRLLTQIVDETTAFSLWSDGVKFRLRALGLGSATIRYLNMKRF